jgi:hypothetical protein
MTSDVQNVPDVWGLLERALPWMATQYGSREEFARLDPIRNQMRAALAQRDRFVLVPKEPTKEIRTALAQAYLFDPNDAFADKMVFVWTAALAAAPKPEGKP